MWGVKFLYSMSACRRKYTLTVDSRRAEIYPVMKVYIDESGNLGRGGRYFIITCLIPHTLNRLKNVVKSCRKKFGKERPGDGQPLDELKGSKLSFTERQHFLNKLTKKQDFEFAYIVADKKYLVSELLARKNICFNYLTSTLLKSIVCGAEEDVEILCDNKDIKVTSGKSLEDYLQAEAYSRWGFKYNLRVNYADSKKYHHLQCVDVISNTVSGRYFLNLGHCYSILREHKLRGIRFPHDKFGA